jgi:hypothetical protein
MKSAWQADSTPFVRLAIRVNGKRNEKKKWKLKKENTKLDISSSVSPSFSSADKCRPRLVAFLINFEEYRINPNLIGKLFSYKDKIMSTDCKYTKLNT